MHHLIKYAYLHVIYLHITSNLYSKLLHKKIVNVT